jgi:HEAT repeat protein
MSSRRSCLVAIVLLGFPLGCEKQKGEKPSGEKDKAFRGRPLREVEEDLRDSDPEVRLEAVKALASTPARQAVPGLRRALEDPDSRVAEQAAKGLRWIGPDASEAVPLLIKRLKNPPSEGFRESAVAALGGIGPKAVASVPLLVEQLRRKKTPLRTRQAAVSSLGAMGPVAREAVGALIDALDDRDLEAPAVGSLIKMGKEARPAVAALSRRLKAEKPYWLELTALLADVAPQAARAAIPDLRALAASAPERGQGIVGFRDSQRRIEEARRLLKRLELQEKQ